MVDSQNGPQSGSLPVPRRYVAIVAISLGAAAVVVDGSAPVVALPQIARELHIDDAAITLVVAVYQLVLLMTLLPFAAIGERMGCKRLYCIGQLVFALASIACLFASDLPSLLLLRALQGLGASGALSATGAMVRAIYPPDQLGRGMGIQGTIISLSLIVAPSFGGFILAIASWPWVFACAAPLSILTLSIANALPKVPTHPGDFDWTAAGLCALMMGLLMTSLEVLAHSRLMWPATALAILGIMLATFFIRSELRQPRPVFPVDLLAFPNVSIGALAALCLYTAAMLMLVTLPFRLHASFGMQPAMIGLVLMFYPAIAVILSPLVGYLSDRYRPEWLGCTGLVISSLAMAFLGLLPSALVSPVLIAAMMAVLGAGISCFMTPNTKIIIAAVPHHRTAAGSGLVALTRLSGQSFGAAMAAIILRFGLGDTGAPALLSALLAAFAASLSFVRLHRSR